MAEVARVLQVPVGVLAGDKLHLAPTTTCVFHRKRASTTIGQAKHARGKLALARMHAESLLELTGRADVRLPRESPTEDGYVTAEDIARHVRSALGIRRGPLENLVGLLETAGAVVMIVDLGGRRLDALSVWTVDRRPVLLVNAGASGERQRFTLAHETGHMVMHSIPTAGIEEQADRFAAELLMPANDIRAELGNPSLEGLLTLKGRWRVSASALARRAYDLGLIGDQVYRRLYTEMSAAGWRAAEPAPVPPEQPHALATALIAARDRLDDHQIAERVGLLPHQLDETFAVRRSA